jgi:hypothetical protein
MEELTVEGLAGIRAEIASLRAMLAKKSRSSKSAAGGADKPKRPQQAHQAFIAHAKDTWPEEYEAFCAEFGRTPKKLEGKEHGGGAIMFASKCRGTEEAPGPHASEWEAFQAAHAERMAEARESGAETSSVSTGSKKSRSLDPDEKARRALVRWLENRELDTEGTLEELQERRAAVEREQEEEKERKAAAKEAKKAAKPAPKAAAKSAPAPKTPAKAAAKTPVKAPAAPVKSSLLSKAAAKKVVVEEDSDEEEEEEESSSSSSSSSAAIVTKPFKFKKVKYQVTTDGYLWLEAADGSRGEYAGKIGDDGTINKDAKNPFA